MLVLFSTTVIWCEEKHYGFGIEAELDNWCVEDDFDESGNSRVANSLNIKLNFSEMLTERFEVNPFLSFGFANDENYTAFDSLTFGIGTGVYYHLIKEKYIDFSTGGRLHTSIDLKPEMEESMNVEYFGFSTAIIFPIIMDIKLSDSFIIRIQHNVAEISYASSKTTQLDTYDKTKREHGITFTSYHNSYIKLNLGFMFKF